MPHLDDGFLHAIADGEVPSDELVAVREHLEGCESCRARLDEARLEAETARELVELIEVPDLPADRPIVPSSHRGGRWLRPLALAASLALAVGIGYYGRGAAPFAPAAVPRAVPDTVFVAAPPLPPAAPAATPARSEPPAGARRADEADKDRQVALQEVVTTATPAAAPAAPPAPKEEEAKVDVARERAAADTRDQAANALARKAAPQPVAQAPAAAGAAAAGRLMAKSADLTAPTPVTFPRAVELLGGRIRLIEGMVPARLEAVGRLVRVVYVLDEGDLVLAQVAGSDTLSWSLTGPLDADSLAKLRLKVR